MVQVPSHEAEGRNANQWETCDLRYKNSVREKMLHSMHAQQKIALMIQKAGL